mmetsp:Transcript_23424/g.64475  ORF Transcript_23424/g.64475 Transcript_23424/m.64475 type:complete len:399 (+) Transcript_23424:185-1381(+)
MPYVYPGQPLHEAYVQRPPLLELWWRLLQPYHYPECPSHIVLRTGPPHSPSNLSQPSSHAQDARLGIYEKTELMFDYRPVYRKKGGDYLYYSHDDHQNWLVGPTWGGKLRAIQSNSQDGAFCPNAATAWVVAGASGEWQESDITAEVKYCGYEGPKLIWDPVLRACGDNTQTATLVSTLTECSMRGGQEMNSASGMSHMGTFWADGAERASTPWNFQYVANDAGHVNGEYSQTDTAQPTMHSGSPEGVVDQEMVNDMLENAEAQLRSFRQCRDHPDMYDGVPRMQKVTGGGFATDAGEGPGVPRCVEIQQMRGRCEGSPEFDFEYYRTCYGRLDQRSTSWFCTRASDVPGGLRVEPPAALVGGSEANFAAGGVVVLALLGLAVRRVRRSRAAAAVGLV